MTKPVIRNYTDLQAEKERLETLMRAQRDLIRQDFIDLRQELQPIFDVASYIGKITTKDKNNPLLVTIADTVIDLVVKKLVLNKAGWITRLTVPFFMKNLSSHLIADNKDGILKKLFSFIRHKNGKPEKEEEEQTQA